FRAFLLVPDDAQVENMEAAAADFRAQLQSVRDLKPNTDTRRLLDALEKAEADHQLVVDRMIKLRRAGNDLNEISSKFEREALPKRRATALAIEALEEHEQRLLEANRQAASDSARDATTLVMLLIALSALL